MQKKPIFLRWWFWPVVLAAFAATWYAQGYIEWFGDQAPYRLRNAVVLDYLARQEKAQTALEKAYKDDPYGGATPEETLRLFVEALEKKDYTLAANYFIPEKVEENIKKMPQGEASGGLAALVKAYRTGTVTFNKSKDEQLYEADVIPAGESIGFYFRFIKNPYKDKWLISEL